MKIKDSLLDPDVFLALIKNNRLKKLVLENVYGIDSCFQQLQNLDSLEILHLCGIDIEEKTLLDLIKKNPLNELSFTTIHVDPSRLFSVLQKKELRDLFIDLPVENAHLALLDNNRHLQSLSLRDASKIDLCGLLFLQNKPLSELELIGLKKWDVSYVYFLQKLPLVFFSLEAEDFTDGDLISLLDLSLTHVKIRHCPNISEKGIIEFSEKAKSQIEIIYGHRISFNTKYFKLKSYTKGGFYEFIPKDYAYF